MEQTLLLQVLPVLFLLCLLAVRCGSDWIDGLYRRKGGLLSYPAAIKERSLYRRPLLTGSFFLCTLRLAQADSILATASLLTATFVLLLIICTDLEQYMIFDVMLLTLAALVLPIFFFLPDIIPNHLLAAVCGSLAFLLLSLLTRGGIGGGDIKLIFVLGLWLGTDKLFLVILAGFMLGGFAALVLLLTGQKKRTSYFAYGPYFAFSALLAMLALL